MTTATTRPRETDPLLSSDETSTLASITPEPVNPRTRCTWPWLHVVILAVLSGAISCVGENLFAAPRMRLLESALCTRYYAQHDPSLLSSLEQIPEHLCKVGPIQDDLAAILGGQFFFDSVPAILFPVPYGLLADKYGRKWILVISALSFPLSYAWTCLAVCSKISEWDHALMMCLTRSVHLIYPCDGYGSRRLFSCSAVVRRSPRISQPR